MEHITKEELLKQFTDAWESNYKARRFETDNLEVSLDFSVREEKSLIGDVTAGQSYTETKYYDVFEDVQITALEMFDYSGDNLVLSPKEVTWLKNCIIDTVEGKI